ncbi:MAG: serine/threonine-protein kinase [bacterium]
MQNRQVDERWLGHFEQPAPIRRMGVFFLYRARRDGAPRVVAVSRPELDPARARAMVAAAVRVHAALAHPAVPPVAEQGQLDDLCFVSFACDAVVDLEGVLESLGDPLPARLPVEATAELLHATVDVLQALHARTDAAPAGRLSAAHVLFSPAGEIRFIGLGCDLMGHQGPAMARRFEAPEYAAVRAGRRGAGEEVDVYLLGALASALVAVEAPRRGMTRVRLGTADVDPAALACWRGLTAADPAARWPDLAAARAAIEALWPAPSSSVWPRLLATMAPMFAAEAPGSVIAGRYRLERRMGFGRRGAWFVAWDQHLNQPVAIKWLSDGGTEAERARLLREVHLLRTLRHPNVMAGYDVLLEDGRIGAVMEYVPGEPLAEVMGQDVPPAVLAAALAGIAEALAYLGRRGIVHRDIKPKNIILHEEREAVLVDLGLARATDSRDVTHPHERLGTFRYMAPEQLTGPSVGPSADVYAFCMVLLDVLADRAAENHPGPTAARALLRAAEVPDVLAELIAAGVAADPARRPSPARLAEALRALEPAIAAGTLVMAADGRWFSVEGQIVDLRRRGALRRILAALGEAHAESGEPLDVQALQRAGWRDERMSPESGRNRVYTAISTLRTEGLKGVLERLDEGYRLSPMATVHRVDANSMPPSSVPPPRL